MGFEHYSTWIQRPRSSSDQSAWCVRGKKGCTKKKNNDVLLYSLFLWCYKIQALCRWWHQGNSHCWLCPLSYTDTHTHFQWLFFFSTCNDKTNFQQQLQAWIQIKKLSYWVDLLNVRHAGNFAHLRMALAVGQSAKKDFLPAVILSVSPLIVTYRKSMDGLSVHDQWHETVESFHHDVILCKWLFDRSQDINFLRTHTHTNTHRQYRGPSR